MHKSVLILEGKVGENGNLAHCVPRDRRILMRRRRKIAKQLANSPAPSKKCKLENELIEIEDKLQASFKKSNDFQETKAIEAIKREGGSVTYSLKSLKLFIFYVG